MRALKIDSLNRIITEIEITDDYRDLQKVVEGLIEVAFKHNFGTSKEHICCVNEEGLLNKPKHFFSFKFQHKGRLALSQPFAGNGVLVGTNENGDTTSCVAIIDYLQQHIFWLDLNRVQELIRRGDINYNTYQTPFDENRKPIIEERKCINVIDLDAFIAQKEE